MDRKTAEETAILALSWMASDDEIIGGFLGMTGAAPDELRARAADPEFLGFVLDYLLSNDDMVLNFSQATNTPTDAALQARTALPGGDAPHWT